MLLPGMVDANPQSGKKPPLKDEQMLFGAQTISPPRAKQVKFTDNIKIISINVNGFRSREAELRRFIEQNGNNCIFSLSDTRLREGISINDIKDYSMLRSDRVSDKIMATAGGVAILVPNMWSCKLVKLKTTAENCEALAAIIFPTGTTSKPFKILSVYNHPKNHFPPGLLTEFKSMMLDGKSIPGLLIGDTNCPHPVFGSRTSNEYGSKLVQLLNQENLIFFNDGSPTYISSSTGISNVLDMVIGDADTCNIVESCSVYGDVGSDHLPVITRLKIKCEVTEKVKVDLKLMAKTVDEKLKHCKLDVDINSSIKKISQIVQEAKASSLKTYKCKQRLLPNEIMENICLRKSVMRNRKKAESDFVKRILTKTCNRLNHQIKNQIEEYDDMQAELLAEKISNSDPNKMWQLFNDFKRKHRAIEEPDTPLITPDGSLASDNKEKCAEFARYLNSVHQTPDNPLFDMNFKAQIDEQINTEQRRSANTNSIKKLYLPQFKQILKETKKNSAPGEDCISYDLMKLCADSTKQTFCNLLNECLTKNVFPNAWKEAKVRMVAKPGRDKNFACNYRPISLLSALGKMYERYIYVYLMKELNEKNFLNVNQAGFIKGKSTQEHLLRLAQGISNGFKKRHCTLGLFIDVKAAFDAVWKNGVKFKINKIGLSNQLENILHSFLDNRTLKVYVNGIWSDTVHLRAGTPQGSVLSPILYLIFVNDLTETLDLEATNASQYADDLGTWVTAKDVKTAREKMQEEVNKIVRWCQKWQVTLNPIKSKLVLFTKCPRHEKEVESDGLSVSLFNEIIQPTSEAEYLGVSFDAKLTWEPHTRKMLTRAYKRLNLLRSISALSKKPNPANLLTIYNSTIRSIFEYASLCVINAAETHLEKLQLVQNQALRAVLRMPAYIAISDLHNSSGIPYIKDHLTAFAKRRFSAMKSKSPLIEKLVEEYKAVQHIHENKSVLDILGV